MLFAAEWIEAWNAHDLDRILTHYADEVEFVSPLIQRLTGDAAGRLVGKAAVREYFAKGLATYPELEFKLIRALPGVGGVALHYRSVNGLLAARSDGTRRAGPRAPRYGALRLRLGRPAYSRLEDRPRRRDNSRR